MKKTNDVYLYVKYTKEFETRLEAEAFGHGFCGYSSGVGTFKKFFEPDDIELFKEADKSIGFGLVDSIGEIESYYPRENDDEHRSEVLRRCLEKSQDSKYRYYWEVPDDGIHISSALTCHDHYGSAYECADGCGTCSGARCCDNEEVIKRWYSVENFHTGDILFGSYNKDEAETFYKSHKLSEEANLAISEICELVGIDELVFRNGYPDADSYSLVYKLANTYGVRVTSRR